MSQIDLFQTILLSLLVVLAGLTEIRYRLDARIKKLDKTINELYEDEGKP